MAINIILDFLRTSSFLGWRIKVKNINKIQKEGILLKKFLLLTQMNFHIGMAYGGCYINRGLYRPSHRAQSFYFLCLICTDLVSHPSVHVARLYKQGHVDRHLVHVSPWEKRGLCGPVWEDLLMTYFFFLSYIYIGSFNCFPIKFWYLIRSHS